MNEYNVVFCGMNNSKSGITYKTINTEKEESVIIKITDGYTGLPFYKYEQILFPNMMYFLNHAHKIRYTIYDIYDKDTLELKLHFEYENLEGIDIQKFDSHNILKDYRINKSVDGNVALPLYEIFVNNIYDRESCNIKNGDVVFDIGGNIGLFTYYSLCRGAEKVYYFEPSTNMYNIAKDNFNIFENIVYENVAVTNSDGFTKFYYDQDNSIGASTNPVSGDLVSICKTINLMSYIQSNNIKNIDYLKLDCEGSEYDIIDSLSDEYLENNITNICMEFHHNTNGVLKNCLDRLERCGFTYTFETNSNINSELGMVYIIKKQFDFEKFFEPYNIINIPINLSRYEFFKKTITSLVSKKKPIYIVETGTMYTSKENNNSCFTMIFADLIKNHTGGKIYTIDISKDHIDKCKEITKEYSDYIEYIVSDSVTYLRNMSDDIIKEIDLFILDSYDLNLKNQMPSAIHHLSEVFTFYYRIKDDAIISIDDNYIPGTYVYWNTTNSMGEITNSERIDIHENTGKGSLANLFLLSNGFNIMTDIIFMGVNNMFCYKKTEK